MKISPYWKNRKKKLRGQGERLKDKIIEKGTSYFVVSKKTDEKVDINELGYTRKFDRGGKMIALNRVEGRRKVKNRLYTKKVKLAKENPHEYNASKNAHGPSFVHPKPTKPTSLTNHESHKLRQTQRLMARMVS